MNVISGGLLVVLLHRDRFPSCAESVRVTWPMALTSSAAVVFAVPALGVVRVPLELPVFLSQYALTIGVSPASLGVVALRFGS